MTDTAERYSVPVMHQTCNTSESIAESSVQSCEDEEWIFCPLELVCALIVSRTTQCHVIYWFIFSNNTMEIGVEGEATLKCPLLTLQPLLTKSEILAFWLTDIK